MQARCFCPEHGRLDFENVLIKNGIPVCAKCLKPLEFGKVLPRPITAAKSKPKMKSRKARKKK